MKVLLQRNTAAELSRQLDEKKITAGAIVDQVFSDIYAHNSSLNAFVSFDYNEAKAAAEASDSRIAAGQRIGPMDGIPVAVKDIIDVGGVVTSYGCSLYANQIAERDAHVIQLLRAAGAIIIGKTNTHQIAMGCTGDRSCWGPVCNPHDLSRMTGGSSSGSASAVAAGLIPIALGSDTGGSIRIPSALCGTVGLKPTHGRVSLTGVLPVWPESDFIGPICRSVEDCAMALDVMTGYDPEDPHSHSGETAHCLSACGKTVSGMRIAVPFEHLEKTIDPQFMQGIQNACRALETGGAHIVQIPWTDYSIYRTAQKLVLHTTCLDRHRHYMDVHKESFDDEVMTRLKNGVNVDMDIQEAQERVKEFRQIFRNLVSEYDAMILPSVYTTAPKLQERYVDVLGIRTQIYEPFSGFL